MWTLSGNHSFDQEIKKNKILIRSRIEADQMWKIIIALVSIIFLLLIVGSAYTNPSGMSILQTKTYTCMDTDDLSNSPLSVKGTVTMIVSGVQRDVFIDYCVDTDILHEFSCDTDTGKKTDSEHSCANFKKSCRYGRCTSDW